MPRHACWSVSCCLVAMVWVGCQVEPVCESSSGGPVDDAEPDEPSTADKWSFWESGTQLRGANLLGCLAGDADLTECLETNSEQDVRDLAGYGANLLVANFETLFTCQVPAEPYAQGVETFDDYLEWADEEDMAVVLYQTIGPGRPLEIFHGDAPEQEGEVFVDPDAREAWLDMWRWIARRYRGRDHLVGYTLMGEPHPEADPDMFATDEEAVDAWNQLVADSVAAIREEDPSTPVIVSPVYWANPLAFPYLEPVDDPYVVYGFSGYEPDAYTHQYPDQGGVPISCPGTVEVDGEVVDLDADFLRSMYEPAIEFAQTHDAVMFANEFGSVRWADGAVEFHGDLLELFEEQGWNYAHYAWRATSSREADDPGAFDLEYGADPDSRTRLPPADNPLLRVHVDRWALNGS